MKIFRLLPALILLLSCSLLPQAVEAPTPTPEAAGETPAAVEMTATLPPTATATPEPVTGLVSGRVCYPSEFIPEMTAYFLNLDSQAYTELSIAENQATYEVELEPGTYLAFAWRGEYGLGGGYTAAVACGMGEACTDHSLLGVGVQAGQTSDGIDLCDWILDGLPLPPGATFPEGERQLDLVGVLFSSPNGLWLVNESGLPELLIGRPDAQLSQDGSYVLYWEADDLWRAPLDGSPAVNLTNTPNRIEQIYRWWQAGPDFVLFPSYATDQQAGPGFNGYLSMVQTDGSGYRLLDGEHPAAYFAISPDDSTVAYGLGPTGWLYRFADDSIAAFVPQDYGFENINTIGSPSWSPDGGRLAWLAGYPDEIDGSATFALVVFDLMEQTYTLIHPHKLPGMDGYPPPAVWSPDGRWLAAQIFDANFERGGLWVFDLDGTAEIFLGGGNPIWSPDGSQLLFTGSDGNYYLAESGSWETSPVELPSTLWFAIDWR